MFQSRRLCEKFGNIENRESLLLAPAAARRCERSVAIRPCRSHLHGKKLELALIGGRRLLRLRTCPSLWKSLKPETWSVSCCEPIHGRVLQHRWETLAQDDVLSIRYEQVSGPISEWMLVQRRVINVPALILVLSFWESRRIMGPQFAVRLTRMFLICTRLAGSWDCKANVPWSILRVNCSPALVSPGSS